MSNNDHKLISTPVSVNEGLRRGDAKTWRLLGLTAVAALVIVVAINLFLPKPKVKWPESPRTVPAVAGPQEPRTYDVVPRRRPTPEE